jgi:predicted metal-binding protein
MGENLRIGIIICDRYRTCAGGKCFRALRNREGAFAEYKNSDVELAAFTTCGGCPGGNIEYAGEEMVKNGVTVVHLATGFLVGYPPCPSIDHFARFMAERYKVRVVIGTHPIPEKYRLIHERLGTWKAPGWEPRLKATISSEKERAAYD